MGEQIRHDDFLESFLGEKVKVLAEEEQEMKSLLAEMYKKRGKALYDAIKKYREENEAATLGDAIRALYRKEEE